MDKSWPSNLSSEERFRILADAVPQIIWSNNAEGKANYFNRRWFEYSGLSEDESVGPGWQAIVHPDDEPASKSRWEAALEKGEIFDTEYRLKRSDNTYRWHIGRNVPVRDESGRITGWFGSATDIQDLKTSDKSLRESRERLRVTLESAEDYAIITLDTLGYIREWSRGAALAFGYTEAQAIGQYTDIIFTPEDRAENIPEKELATALRDGMAKDERWHLRKDGSRFFMSGVTRPIYNPQLAGYVKVARDTTDQKVLEQRKDEFIGIASHELKTPVTSIRALAELLLEHFEEGNDTYASQMMQKLTGQVNRLTDLIKDLLDTTKLVEGRFPLQLELFEINNFIEKHIEDLKRISPGHKFRFELESPVLVTADRERIGQVLTNLVSNAIKYSDKSSTVYISTQKFETEVKVSVADEGIGIPKELQHKVFDRFFRVTSEKMQTYPGMGLGLYISAGIVQRHGGTISVESREEQGSKFSFTIPLKK